MKLNLKLVEYLELSGGGEEKEDIKWENRGEREKEKGRRERNQNFRCDLSSSSIQTTQMLQLTILALKRHF